MVHKEAATLTVSSQARTRNGKRDKVRRMRSRKGNSEQEKRVKVQLQRWNIREGQELTEAENGRLKLGGHPRDEGTPKPVGVEVGLRKTGERTKNLPREGRKASFSKGSRAAAGRDPGKKGLP